MSSILAQKMQKVINYLVMKLLKLNFYPLLKILVCVSKPGFVKSGFYDAAATESAIQTLVALWKI